MIYIVFDFDDELCYVTQDWKKVVELELLGYIVEEYELDTWYSYDDDE